MRIPRRKVVVRIGMQMVIEIKMQTEEMMLGTRAESVAEDAVEIVGVAGTTIEAVTVEVGIRSGVVTMTVAVATTVAAGTRVGTGTETAGMTVVATVAVTVAAMTGIEDMTEAIVVMDAVAMIVVVVAAMIVAKTVGMIVVASAATAVEIVATTEAMTVGMIEAQIVDMAVVVVDQEEAVTIVMGVTAGRIACETAGLVTLHLARDVVETVGLHLHAATAAAHLPDVMTAVVMDTAMTIAVLTVVSHLFDGGATALPLGRPLHHRLNETRSTRPSKVLSKK